MVFGMISVVHFQGALNQIRLSFVNFYLAFGSSLHYCFFGVLSYSFRSSHRVLPSLEKDLWRNISKIYYYL